MGGLVIQASTFAASVDSLFLLVLTITGIAFVVVEGILVYFLIRYRHRRGQKAAYVHGNRRLEAAWTIGTGVMFLSLAIYQYGAWTRIKLELPDESQALVVGVSANQFEWEPTYPGPDGKLCTPDDQRSAVNELHFPVDQPVVIRVKSEDVLHSFFIPELRVKQDAVPGMLIRFWFQATQSGNYEIACAELCGLGHYRMRGKVTVEPQAEFAAWSAEQAASESEHDYCQVEPVETAE